ncbi:MAG TPA: GNAT family N-acetyltransferase [Polyangiaceae bacterium]|nr:GNAT family N-acetyltransferase [Polyangiaceae bacterium]
MAPVEVVEADLSRPDHQEAVVSLVDAYARDPMGGGEPLSAEARGGLIPGLRAHPTTLVFLAYLGGRAVGVAVCFLGFSTFAAKPLVNVHDLGVLPECRGRGVGRLLLGAVERRARALGCCKLTLEVLENNRPARALYESVGFAPLTYQESAGGALFLSKKL